VNPAERTLRSISFLAPRAGTATVSFHGTAFCINNSREAQRRGVHIESQIMTVPNAHPVASGPGGNIYRFTLDPDLTEGGFNLASTRVFPINSAGENQYFFRVIAYRQTSVISCEFYNMSFTVQFVPR
jgi:hypothetical protein